MYHIEIPDHEDKESLIMDLREIAKKIEEGYIAGLTPDFDLKLVEHYEDEDVGDKDRER